MSASWIPALAVLGQQVLAAAVVAAVAGSLVALVLRRLPATPPALRAWIWWLVAARTLAELAGAPPLELAWLPARETPPALATRGAIVVEAGPATLAPVVRRREPIPAAAQARAAAVPWQALIGAAWAAATLAALAASARELVRVRRRLARAKPVADPETLAVLDRVAGALGLGGRARLALSDEIAVPQVAGFLRATVLLPRAAVLTGDELEMTLAHELAHVRRREGVLALVPFLAERLFVWHPLVRLAASEYALASEQACDAVVLERWRPAPERYGRLLLRFALQTPPAPAVAAWPLARRPLERRLEMIERILSAPRRAPGAIALGVALVVAVAVPLRLVAATPQPSAVPPAPVVPALAPVPPVPPVPPASGERLPSAAVPAMAPVPPVPATMPVAPVPPVPPAAITPPDLDGASVVVVDGDRTLSMNASNGDVELARRLHGEDGQPALVFRRAGEPRRVVRDRATIDAVLAVVNEQARTAREQAEHARRQADGARREAEVVAGEAQERARELAARARALGESLGTGSESARESLEAELAALEVRLAEVRRELEAGVGREAGQLDRERGEFERMRRDFDRERAELDREAERLRERSEHLRDDAGRRILEILERAPANPPQR